MISGTHVVVYSKSTDADRAFPAWPPFTVEELQVKFFGNLGNSVPDVYVKGGEILEIKDAAYIHRASQIQAQLAAAAELMTLAARREP